MSIPEPPQNNRHAGLGWRIFTAALIVVMLAMLGWAFGAQVTDAQQKHDALVAARAENVKLQNANAKLAGQYANLYNQLKKTGASPQSPTPAQVQSSAGLPKAGAPGAQGQPGAQGVGVQILTCDVNGAWHEHFSDGSVQIVQGPCIGATGPQGVAGAASTVPGPQGDAGQDGAASTVPGPAGPAGPAGADSTVPGPPGSQGAAGADGQPPYSWTQPGTLPGTTVTCTRAAPFDPAQPEYVCS